MSRKEIFPREQHRQRLRPHDKSGAVPLGRTLRRPTEDGSAGQGHRPQQYKQTEKPQPVEALESGVLAGRREVVLANRRARKAAKPAYVNTDACWRDGFAGLAYVGALGTRTEVVVCADNHAGEYLALLMAMEDAERCLGGKIAFRMDSQTVVNLQAGSNGQFEELRARVKLLLAHHPDWTLVLVEGNRNKIADGLSRRAFRQTDKAGVPDGASILCRKNEGSEHA